MTKENESEKSGYGGFSDNPLMLGYDNQIFEGDKDLGFRFPEWKVISSKGFVSLEEVIRKTKGNTGYTTILNVGDSSTSGWDSNQTFKGNKDTNAPFFNYKTYSDLLEEQLFANVINAGVPGYTSYQGRKNLKRLLKKLATDNIKVDYVTIYFGNNDCAYNKIEDRVRIDRKQPSERNSGERVSVKDYKRNLKSIIETAREYGVKPVLIVPPVHYDWEPGIRADKHREESIEILKQLGDCPLTRELQIAKELYDQKKYKQACQTERVLPRLKKEYKKALIWVARETKTDLIDVQNQIPLTENSEYFADYCHPLEKVNQMIVDKFRKIRSRDLFHKPIKEKVFGFLKKENNKKEYLKCQSPTPPSNIYTLY
ncbi:MAG: hypothetical protein KKG60_01630 [Nanoarchaeota archaeon]|nr:hypothetical protein [Nanoarchaeota archaeon]